MMKMLEDHGSYKYYQLDFKVYKYRFGATIETIKDLFINDPIKLKPEFELAEDVSECIDKICVSDAHTHIERLVFPVFYIKQISDGKIKLCHRCNLISGKWTMRIHGGDHNSVYKPEVYERQLRSVNRHVTENNMKWLEGKRYVFPSLRL